MCPGEAKDVTNPEGLVTDCSGDRAIVVGWIVYGDRLGHSIGHSTNKVRIFAVQDHNRGGDFKLLGPLECQVVVHEIRDIIRGCAVEGEAGIRA